jgi:hypothetical protein
MQTSATNEDSSSLHLIFTLIIFTPFNEVINADCGFNKWRFHV